MSTLEGFRADLDTYEKAMTRAGDEAVKKITEDYIEKVSQKDKPVP